MIRRRARHVWGSGVTCCLCYSPTTVTCRSRVQTYFGMGLPPILQGEAHVVLHHSPSDSSAGSGARHSVVRGMSLTSGVLASDDVGSTTPCTTAASGGSGDPVGPARGGSTGRTCVTSAACGTAMATPHTVEGGDDDDIATVVEGETPPSSQQQEQRGDAADDDIATVVEGETPPSSQQQEQEQEQRNGEADDDIATVVAGDDDDVATVVDSDGASVGDGTADDHRCGSTGPRAGVLPTPAVAGAQGNGVAPTACGDGAADDRGCGSTGPCAGVLSTPVAGAQGNGVAPTACGDGVEVCSGAPPAIRRHRRVDLKAYPFVQFPYALMSFTGPDVFNRTMRYRAKQLYVTSCAAAATAAKLCGIW